MSNISSAIRYFGSATPNPDLIDLNQGPGSSRPFQRADNADVLAEIARRLRGSSSPRGAASRAGKKKAAAASRSAPASPADGGGVEIAPDGVLSIGLIGEYGQLGYALRRAQEVIRIDRTPSHWSHAFLFLDPISTDPAVNRDPQASPRVLESSLTPSANAAALFAFRNGVNVRRFSDYARAAFDLETAPGAPNFAVLSFGLTAQERAAISERAVHPEADLGSYDLPDLIGAWLQYALNLGKQLNPLARGVATPSASFLQLAYDAAGIDLSPGSRDRNIAPEHLWQAVRFLRPLYELPGGPEGSLRPRPFVGFSCVREPNCLLCPVDVSLPKTFEEFVRDF